jgi:hypothetical protein
MSAFSNTTAVLQNIKDASLYNYYDNPIYSNTAVDNQVPILCKENRCAFPINKQHKREEDVIKTDGAK